MAKFKSPLGSIRGSSTEAKHRFETDRREREAAGKAPRSIILSPNDVRGQYDAGRVLTTTLGGERRPLTHEDLATFRRNMQTVGKLTAPGVTARQVIDIASSGPLMTKLGDIGDLGRAREQIKMAAPVAATVSIQSRRSLDVRFLTDASPDSKVARHTVIIRLLGYGEQLRILAAAPLDPDKAEAEKARTPKQAADALRKGYLAFDCDCERHRYFFRYVATIGGFNAGRDETGYPKVRNPTLRGIACKHVLRVMAELQSSAGILSFLEKAMSKAQASIEKRVSHAATQAEADAVAAKQAAKPREILTTEQRKAISRAARARRSIIAAAQVAAAESPARRVAPATRRLTSGQKDAVALLAKQFGFSSEEVVRRLLGQS
ncbi:hypothetical protein [Lysobacter sp. FW306-1B-D06B]|uniref:hypothetical protein n=1 Tax=Lysobacter sp. FW306-1B-D06B TaxID=3140250 RepID=UPI003140688F